MVAFFLSLAYLAPGSEFAMVSIPLPNVLNLGASGLLPDAIFITREWIFLPSQ